MISRTMEEDWLEEDWRKGLMGKGQGESKDGRGEKIVREKGGKKKYGTDGKKKGKEWAAS